MANKYVHWKNEHPRKPDRARIHLAENSRETICGYRIKEKELTRVTEGVVKSQKIKMCSNCMKQLEAKDPASLKDYPHGKPRRNTAKGQGKSKKKQSATDKICHPKLTKFKKILHSAKEQKAAIESALETALEVDEMDIPALEKIYKSLPELEQWLGQAQDEADIKWKEDHNKFNDTKHFHIISCLRNFALALDSLKEI